MNLTELEHEMIRLSRLLDAGIETMIRYAGEYATAEDQYRLRRAQVHIESSGTVADRNARVDLATSKERVAAHTADGMRKAATEAVRSRRQQLSALQTLVSAHKSEAEFARTGPRELQP